MTSIRRLECIDELLSLQIREKQEKDAYEFTITACSGTGCRAAESQSVCEALQEQIDLQGLADRVSLKRTGCHGFCEQGPLVIIEPENTLYCKVKPADAAAIFADANSFPDGAFTCPVDGSAYTLGASHRGTGHNH